MNTQRIAQKPSIATGFRALLCGLSPIQGVGASSVLLLALGVLVLTPGVASANSAHGFLPPALGTGPGSEAGELELAAPSRRVERDGEKEPQVIVAGSGVAVNDKTHDVYVADTGNHRVDVFNAAGVFQFAFGANVGGLGQGTCTLMCEAGASGSAPGELAAPRFVAVDNSSGPSKGDVYVGDGVGKEAQNEQQFIAFSGATSGTYTLTFEDPETHTKETTGDISFVAERQTGAGEVKGKDAEAAQQALEALPGLAGNVTVGHTLKAASLEIEFAGALKETAIPPLGCDGSSLSPQPATCEVGVVQEGSHFAGEIISKFNSSGTLQASWGTGGQLDGSTAAEGPFAGQLDGIAVDHANGDLWVLNRGGPGFVNGQEPIRHHTYLYKFGEDGTYEAPTQYLEFGAEASGIAINGEGKLVTAPQGDTGLALDTAPGGALYLDSGGALEQVSPHEVFGSEQLGAGGGAGVAVDSSTGEQPFSGSVYAANTTADQVDVFPEIAEAETAAATEVQTTSMVLHGVVNPLGSEVGECYFEYGTTNEYGRSVPCAQSPAAIGAGKIPVPVSSAKLEALRGGTTYHFRLVVIKGTTSVPGDDAQARTLTAPVITGGEAPLLDVTATTAQLRANVNPEGLPVSRCQFEYGTSTAYGHRVKCEQTLAQIGYGTEPVPVSATITGLQPNTTYYWRLSVRDEHGEAYEPGHTFVYPTTGSVLPDNRSYEMVSPVQKNGASLTTTFFGNNYAFAGNGSSIQIQSIQCFAEAVSCTASLGVVSEGEPFQLTRTPAEPSHPAAWKTTALAPPASQFGPVNAVEQYSPNEEGMALFVMPSAPAEADSWYARQPGGTFTPIGPVTQPGISTNAIGGVLQDRFKTATADLSHVFWDSEDYTQWPFLEHPGNQQVLEYVGGHNSEPMLVGVENAGPPPWQEGATHVNEGAKLISGCTELGSDTTQWNAVSADGRTVYVGACHGALYARVDGETPEAHTIRISPGVAEFEGASTDGAKAFFTEGENLYESECTAHCQGSGDEESREERAPPIDVSAGSPAPEVRGAVVATSADGSHVYFAANGVLTGAPNGYGQRAAPGHCGVGDSSRGFCNLYLYERDERYPRGHLAFIATVPGTDHTNWEGTRVANVTPDGRFLVFESHGTLTPDDTRSDGVQQIFRYDADQTAREQTENVPALVRVSIGNDGYNDDGNAGVPGNDINGESFTGGPGIVIGAVGADFAGPARGDPTMSNDGSRVFFTSPIGLTPRALNDVFSGYETTNPPEGEPQPIKTRPFYAENVYEWESEGVGSCPAGHGAGCVYLISDGHDVTGGKNPCGRFTAVCLLGADESGQNVFFLTTDQLVPKDTDTQVDIYDARICEPEQGNPCITEPPPPLPPCDGESCHGIPPERSPLLTGGSETLNGKGNITSSPPPPAVVKKKTPKCKRVVVKKKGKKKTECIQPKRSKKAKNSTSKSSKNRGPGR